jgi:hypothetical protein
MKLGLQNYVVIIPTENSYIKFNNEISNLQMYNTAQYYRILHTAVQLLSQHNLKILNHHHIEKALPKKMIEIKLVCP